MQPKNSSKASLAKVAQANKITIVSRRNTTNVNLNLNDKKVLLYQGGSTLNCQIGTLKIEEPELLSAYLETLTEKEVSSFWNNLLDSCRESRRMVGIYFRSKYFPNMEAILKGLGKDIKFSTIYYINGQKFTNILITIQ